MDDRALKKFTEELATNEGIATQWDISSYQKNADANVVTYNWVTGSKFCKKRGIIDIAGTVRTDENGVVKFSAFSFHCESAGPVNAVHDRPINLVSTARSRRPVIVTCRHELDAVANGVDILVTLYTWNTDGSSAPGVICDWRLQSEFNVFPIIN